jgi:hypothetical protein
MGNCCKKPRQQQIITLESQYNHNINSNNNNNNSSNENLIYSFGGNECIICLENPVQAGILECGHIQFCVRCVNAMINNTDINKAYLNNCPVCRTPIKGYMTFTPNYYLKYNY